jgi:hypothetical protein
MVGIRRRSCRCAIFIPLFGVHEDEALEIFAQSCSRTMPSQILEGYIRVTDSRLLRQSRGFGVLLMIGIPVGASMF